MPQENVEVVKRAVAALNERDIDRYLAGCTEDIEVRTPFAPIAGVYRGPDDVRRYFADIQDTSPDFRLELERVEAIGADRVLAFLRATASWRASGIPAAAGVPTTNLYDLVDGKIRRVRIFLDRQKALEAAGLSGARRSL
jgi:ketosteroid isomerase-like protein